MVNRWMMGHRWLTVLVLVCGLRNGLCDLTVTMKRTMTGVKGDPVVIPCTHTTSSDYELYKVEWEFNSNSVIYRTDDSQEHILQVRYRKRASISNSPEGDVSLTLRKLDINDRGNFKCKVTWKDKSSQLKTKEDVTILKVVRTRPVTKKPDITTAEEKVTTGVSTVEDAFAFVTTKQPKKFHISTVPTIQFSTAVDNNPAAEAIKGSGIWFYMIIIGLLCILAVLILTIVLINRRKKNKNFNYTLPSMNQLSMNLEGHSPGGGGCQSSVEPPYNNFELLFSRADFERATTSFNDYEQLIIRSPEEKASDFQTSQSSLPHDSEEKSPNSASA